MNGNILQTLLRQVMGVSLIQGALPWTVWAVSVGLTVALIASLALADAHARRWLAASLIASAASGAVGLLAAWLVSDVFMVFGVSLGWPVILTVAAGVLGLGFAVALIVVSRRWRRIVAAVLVPLTLLASALGVDALYGEYRTLGDLFGYNGYGSFSDSDSGTSSMSVAEWRRLAAAGEQPHTPAHGKVLTVSVPNTASGFTARTAMVYLPPAALASRKPALPVMEMLAGQPGSPGRLIHASGIATMMDDYAAAHDGLAPIVVVPDQNGSNTHNSLCADTTQGKAETYLTVDVPRWVRRNLPAADEPSMWAIGGFSQGGTCATQLGPRHPEIYGAMLPVDGELQPTAGSVEDMVRDYFDGDRQAYEEQVPTTAIAAHAPSTQGLFAGAGERDRDSLDNMRTIAAAARKAGMDVTELVAADTGHDWHAVQAVWRPGIDWFGERTGLGAMAKAAGNYPGVRALR